MTGPTKPPTRGGTVSSTPAPFASAVERELEDFGLSGNETVVLLAMLRLGSANTAELARASGISRTNVYKVLDELVAKNLVERLPGEGPAVWVSCGREQVVERLYAAQEERLRELSASAERIRTLLPEGPEVARPQIHILHKAAAVKRAYQRLVREVESEILIFNKPPFAWTEWSVGKIPSPLLEPLARGVSVKSIWEPLPEEFRGLPIPARVRTTLDAGEKARVYPGPLPMKLSVFDRKYALVAVPGVEPSDNGFPLSILVEDEGFAFVQATAFDKLWDDSSELDA